MASYDQLSTPREDHQVIGEAHNRSIRALIRCAGESGVRLWVEGDSLRYRAPKGGIPEALSIALRARRDELIGELSRPVFRKRADSPEIVRYPSFWADFWLETQANPWLRHGTYFVIRLTGDISLERISTALERLTFRHDLVRSKVSCEEGVPCLRLDPRQRVSAGIVDVSNEPTARRALKVDDLLYRAIYSPFEEGQVFRATVLKCSGEEYVVAVVVHHFVGDAFTCEIVAAELIASLQGKSLPQPGAAGTAERPLQYSDYLLAITEWLSGPGLRYRLAFWKEKMRGAPRVSFPPPPRAELPDAPKGESVTIRVSSAIREGIARVAAASQVPLPVVLLAAKFAALSRSLDSVDLVVTIVHWGRDESVLLELIGFTLNCIPVRVSVRPDMSYAALLTSVNDTYNLARDYQVPWALLTRSFAELGASSAAPLFNYIYEESLSVGNPNSSSPTSSLKVERLHIPAPNNVISVDWKTHQFTVFDDGKELVVNVTYLPDRCETAAVRKFADSFLRCLHTIGEDLRRSLGDL